MREIAKWVAVGLWLTVAFVLGHSLSVQNRPSQQLDILHPLTFAEQEGQPVIVRCTERIIEGPFVHRNLPYPFQGRVLDVGYRESQLIYELASLGFETWGIEIRPPLLKFPHVQYVTDDVCQHRFPTEYFDVVISLSTIEHIGLWGYGNENYDAQGDLRALRAMRRALKPSGYLILTIPFGKSGETATSRYYDHKSLLALLAGAGFEVETENYWYEPDIQWVPTSWQTAEQTNSLATNVTRAVACIRAKPVAAK